MITKHRQYEHNFDWDNNKILDEEPCYNKCLISEMLKIKKQKKTVYLQKNSKPSKKYPKTT